VLFVNDGSSPCEEASWRQLPAPAKGPGAAQTFDSTPAFVYAHQFAGTDQVRRGTKAWLAVAVAAVLKCYMRLL
jgi:hypothetical protein